MLDLDVFARSAVARRPFMDQIERHVLRDEDTAITVLSLGCAVMDWRVRGRHVVLGYADPEHYRQNPASMGVVCGRVINRIENARFELGGVDYVLPANAGAHHLHGGPGGLGWRTWTMDRDGDCAVQLSLVSDDGDQGYPGRVAFTVVMRLEGGRLTWEMSGMPDRETPVNLGQHLYFNLMGQGTLEDHTLWVDADTHTPNRPDLVPYGAVEPVAGTAFDFRAPVRLGDGDVWDGNLVLNGRNGFAAQAVAPDGMRLRLWTDRPGLQVYTSNTLAHTFPEGPGASHRRFAGLCLEAQDMPNAVNVPAFGSILCAPDRPYRQTTSIEIG
jgi:aldose 1-epimerase